jgi:predicted  nucleic acid-binding Zn-ribbon protein
MKIVNKKKINRERKLPVTQRQFGVILEDINSKMDLVVEGHKMLDEKNDRAHHEFDKKIDGLDRRIDGLDRMIDGLDEKIDSVHQGLGGKIDRNYQEFLNFRKETNDNFKVIFEYLSRIDDELRSIKIEIRELKNSLSKKADLERLEVLERRVIDVEKENIQMRSILKQHNFLD